MKVVSLAQVAERLEALAPNEPRIVVSGNFATPWELVHLAAATIPVFRFFVLNPQAGWPRRASGLVVHVSHPPGRTCPAVRTPAGGATRRRGGAAA